MMTKGFVSLVGAGPGDPDLLTIQAMRCLRNAELVLYDSLVSPEILAQATQAQRFCVGKRAGRKSISQSTITRVMIRAAHRGRHVVRLKCGDPYVLGRGGEEALALRSAGVPFEIVPGLTTAVAAPALAGIPLTHRGLASSFVVLSGHNKSSFGPIIESLPPGKLTIVILMGLAQRTAIATCLLKRGWKADTPVAIVFGASTTRNQTWSGMLKDFLEEPFQVSPQIPGTIIIGEVVNMRTSFATPQDFESSNVVKEKN